MDASDFRTRQALADLRMVRGLSRADRLGPTILNAKDETALCAAAAETIISSLESGTCDALLADLWEVRSERLGRAPPPIRAALVNGLQRLVELGLFQGADVTQLSERVTLPRRLVESALIRIGRKMSADEIEHVARADYGCDVVRHRTALRAVLDHPELAYPDGEAWYPAEVVELVSHVPGQPGHVPCLAIVLLDALRTGDAQGNAEYRLQQQFTELSELGSDLRDPLFAAFRHLYESVPHWSPPVPAAFTLPWVATLGPSPAKSARRKR